EVTDQLLPDGGHVERSPSYHRQVVSDLDHVAELVRRTGQAIPPWLDAAVSRGEAWQAALAGPDGRLPLLNDAWEGPSLAGDREPVTWLEHSGHTVFRHECDQAVLDVGPLCPPHLPPHAHADAL